MKAAPKAAPALAVKAFAAPKTSAKTKGHYAGPLYKYDSPETERLADEMSDFKAKQVPQVPMVLLERKALRAKLDLKVLKAFKAKLVRWDRRAQMAFRESLALKAKRVSREKQVRQARRAKSALKGSRVSLEQMVLRVL